MARKPKVARVLVDFDIRMDAIAEWLALSTYGIGDRAGTAVTNGSQTVYESLTASNVGNQLIDEKNWRLLYVNNSTNDSIVESVIATGLSIDDEAPEGNEGIEVDPEYLNISITGGGWDILTFAPARDSRLYKENLKFLGLVIEDDSHNVGLRKEWRSPFFGNCEYTIDPYISPSTKITNTATQWPQQVYTMSTVSTFLDDDDDKDIHKFSIVYYDRRADKVRVFDPGIRNQED